MLKSKAHEKELLSSKSATQFNRNKLMNLLFWKDSNVCYIPTYTTNLAAFAP